VAAAEYAIRDDLFLEYRVEGSTGPGTSRAVTERFTFHQQPDGRFEVRLQGEEMTVELYTAAYGAPLLVDAALVAANGMPLQFRGLCPFVLTPSQRAADAEVAWIWDGAGVQDMSDPEDQIIAKAVVRGPITWRKWSAWLLERKDLPPTAPAPAAYYEQVTGLLVGVEYRTDLPEGRFIYCDAELQSSSAGEL
jgi:hypothetical protein